MSYADDRGWSDLYLPAVKRIVGPHLLEAAPFDLDARQGTDLIILNARDKRIAVRLRRPGYSSNYPWDFTIRCERASGAATEYQKLCDGFGDWFFYGHAADEGLDIARWMLLDLAAWRSHLMRTATRGRVRFSVKGNKDGQTQFMAFDARSFEGNPRLLIAASHAHELEEATSDV